MELALRINSVVGTATRRNAVTLGEMTPARGAFFFGITLAIFQAIDGLLTAMGIDKFGLSMEGNPVLRNLMEEFGHGPTLAVLKIAAISVIVALVLASRQIRWIKAALGALTFVYLCAAIIPWTYILFINPVA